jgi:hypothetical protein
VTDRPEFDSEARRGIGEKCEAAACAWWTEIGCRFHRILEAEAFDRVRVDWSVPEGFAVLPDFVVWSATRRPVLVDVKSSEWVAHKVLRRANEIQTALDMFVVYLVCRPLLEPAQWRVIRADTLRDLIVRSDVHLEKNGEQTGDRGYTIPLAHAIPASEFWS